MNTKNKNEEKEKVQDVNADLEDPNFGLPYTYKLQTPVQMGSKAVESVKFQNEVNGDMVGELPAGGREFMKMKHFAPIISKMTGETTIVVGKMEYRDFENCLQVVSHFLGDGQTTGTET